MARGAPVAPVSAHDAGGGSAQNTAGSTHDVSSGGTKTVGSGGASGGVSGGTNDAARAWLPDKAMPRPCPQKDIVPAAWELVRHVLGPAALLARGFDGATPRPPAQCRVRPRPVSRLACLRLPLSTHTSPSTSLNALVDEPAGRESGGRYSGINGSPKPRAPQGLLGWVRSGQTHARTSPRASLLAAHSRGIRPATHSHVKTLCNTFSRLYPS